MTNPFMQLANILLSKNPQIANNPNIQNYIQIIQNGNSQQGEKIAENLCQTYGITKEEATEKARKFFGL